MRPFMRILYVITVLFGLKSTAVGQVEPCIVEFIDRYGAWTYELANGDAGVYWPTKNGARLYVYDGKDSWYVDCFSNERDCVDALEDLTEGNTPDKPDSAQPHPPDEPGKDDGGTNINVSSLRTGVASGKIKSISKDPNRSTAMIITSLRKKNKERR